MGKGFAHNTENERPVSIAEWEEHGHINADDTQAAYKKVRILDDSGTPINSFGGGTQYTEDAVAVANPVGNTPILVRQDTPASEVSANGDNIAQRSNAYGAAYTQVVTSAGAFVDTFGGGTQYAEDTVHVSGDTGTLALAVRNDAGTSMAANGDYTPLQTDQNGALRTSSSGLVSTLNSTTATLGAGGVFTGTFEEVKDASVISLLVIASHVSATDGLEIQWSTDSTNIDDTDNFTIPANNGKFYTLPPESRYFRVKYTNGGTIQTYFRLQSIIHSTYIKPSSHRIGETVSGEDDGELVKAVIAGQKPDGTYGNVDTTTAGNLKISVEEYSAGAGNIAKAEDSASANADLGAAVMAVRKATPANTSGTDGDYEMLQMSVGRLWTSSTIDAALPAGDNNIGNVDIVTTPSVSSATLANVASSATNVTLIASNTSRKAFHIFNDSTSALYIKFGATASTTSFTVKVLPAGYYESHTVCYTGIIDGIWDSANGSARITEL